MSEKTLVLAKASRGALLEALSAATGIVERRHTLPILSNVLVERDGGALAFLATDLEIQIRSLGPVSSQGEAAATTVSARKLLDILRSLESDAEVTLQLQERRLVVRSGRSRFSLQTLPAEDFPRMARASGEAAEFELGQKDLRQLLSLVQYAMAQQDIRYYLNGLLLVVEDGRLKLVATDGHRLAFVAMALAPELPRQEAIVPRKTVLELARLLGDGEDPVRVRLGGGQAGFAFGAVDLVSKLVDGKFPDYTRVIPTSHPNRLAVEREALRQALARAAILSNEKFRGVRLVLGDATLRIIASNAEGEEAEETLAVEYRGEPLDIGFNVNYLLDLLNHVTGRTVCANFGDASSSALFEVEGEPEFRYVVMPMRI